jgi:hypothetical protein
MPHFRVPCLILAMALTSACGNGAIPTGSSISSISMSLAECEIWGSCPSYSVTLDSDGNVFFKGSKVVKKFGSASRTIPTKDFLRLAAIIEEFDYFHRWDSYATPQDGCTGLVTDQSSVTFSVTRNDHEKRLFYYFGCEGSIRSDVESLARSIYVTAKLEEWVGVAP